MQWIVGLFILLLAGCQGFPLQESGGEKDPDQIMSLWARYQRCQTATDPDELFHMAQLFDSEMIRGEEPPSWLKVWGQHVKAQPIRASIDPRALGAACTLRVAATMARMDRPVRARLLYERVLVRYSSSDWAYYASQAKDALEVLSETQPVITASALLPSRPLEK